MLAAVASAWDPIKLIKIDKGTRWEIFSNSQVTCLVMVVCNIVARV